MARIAFADRVAAIEALGFTARQAAFLTTVALHSGYCLRRQYAAFTGQKYGKNVCDFFDRLVYEQLARRHTYRADRGSIYHLYARRLYAALGEENNRNRRHSSPELIVRKLMVLDFVLTQPDHDWYATEREKVECFVSRLGVPVAALPHRTYSPRFAPPSDVSTTRYWVQKLPFFVTATPLTVHFVCAATDAGATAIEAFVREHAVVLRRLSRWCLHVVLARGGPSDVTCTAAFHRALRTASLPPVSGDDLAWFQQTRALVDGGRLSQVTVEDLRRYRELATKVSSESARPLDGRLVVDRLEHGYEQFGSILNARPP